MNLKIISAGAGSGKTYTLTNQMADLLTPNPETKEVAVRAAGIIATTFTNKAAAELKERVRIKLLDRGLSTEADDLSNAMIGTVHAIGVQLLKRFAFEAGVSPDVDIIADTDHQSIFNQSLATVLPFELIEKMNHLSERLGFLKGFRTKDWRKELRELVNIARSNNFQVDALEQSKQHSIDSFIALLPPVSEHSGHFFDAHLAELLEKTLLNLNQNEDKTKSKHTLIGKLKGIQNTIRNKGALNWYTWASIPKMTVPKKSRDDAFDLQEFAKKHLSHPHFRRDVTAYISTIFDTAIAAIQEYQSYKQARGLIDYTDMEVMILELLENDLVLEVLQDEIDLLLVDEFQDTNPIQLQIFLKLTQIAKQAIWVGDPKQSIYGFRGAAPELMEAVISSTDNIENLPNSWRSRADLVHGVNGLFVEAFGDSMPPERIALIPAYPKAGETEPEELKTALHHWHFNFEGKRSPKKPWMERCIARSIVATLQEDYKVRIKGTNELRPIQPSDIAVLCRSNSACQAMASALNAEGLAASIARTGLLQTAESALLMACLRFILNKHDALSVAEIMLLASKENIEDILAHRMSYLHRERIKAAQEEGKKESWRPENTYIELLHIIRYQSKELSAAEILNWVIERLDVRRIVASWPNADQRLSNVDALRKLALDYEDSCTRLHSAATLGGFLLWLDDLADAEYDAQGRGAGKDAVHVMTYHKSKGLEWPFVVCHSLEGDLKDSIWGFRIFSTADKIDIQRPLDNRLLCYWVNPYADQIGKTALEELVQAHPDFLKSQKAALAEEARVLYVGLTRARDYLIFPTKDKKEPKWLNRVYHHGKGDLPSLPVQSNELLWTWQEQLIPLKTQLFNYETTMSNAPDSEKAIHYLPPRAGQQQFEAAQTDFSQLLPTNAELRIGKTHHFAKSLVLNPEIDYLTVQSVFKTYLLGYTPTQTEEQKEAIAQLLLKQYELTTQIRSKDLLYYAKAFYYYLEQTLGILTYQKYYSFIYYQDSQMVKSVLDLVGSNEKGEKFILQSAPQVITKIVQQKNNLKEEMATLHFAAQHLNSTQTFIWQPLEGTFVKTDIKQIEKQSSLF
jgi:ATP-dependent exoDNAse (exonuclease V) beta subunit